jgi:hypothetical protein
MRMTGILLSTVLLALSGCRSVQRGVPLFEAREREGRGTYLAARPFYGELKSTTDNRHLYEYLWPIGMYKTFRGESYWRVLTAFGHDFDINDGNSRFRFILFPFVFTGRDKNGQDYFALFPVGGQVHEFLTRDVMGFFLFPLYAYSRTDDVRTWDILWPIVSWSKGDGVRRFRIFPFYGYSHNEGRSTKEFILWPFWTAATYHHPKASGHAFVFFPFYGRIDMTDQQGLMILPPFFRFSRGEDHRVVYCPWPFIQYETGRYEKLFLWPLWGRLQHAGLDRTFFLWPVGWVSKQVFRDGSRVHSFRVVPVFASRVHVRDRVDPETGESAGRDVLKRQWRLWPLCSYGRQGDASRFRLLELWPGGWEGPVERNWAPLWTLYQHTESGDEKEDEALWGLYRHRRDAEGTKRFQVFPLFMYRADSEADSRRWSVLGGLIGRSREGEKKTFRLLYFLKIPLG